jgi:hypothetical protein
MPMPDLLEFLGDGEKITAETALRSWDRYIPMEWDGRLVPGQFRSFHGMLLPDGVKYTGRLAPCRRTLRPTI